MGNLFGRKKETRVTEQDKAVLVSSFYTGVLFKNLIHWL